MGRDAKLADGAAVALEIYVVRHAIAEDRDRERWPDDSQRPLTVDGRKKFEDAARGLRRMAPEVSLLYSSPYVRAADTARILERQTGWPEAELRDELTPAFGPPEVLDVLRSQPDAAVVAVVGHEPGLSELVSYLLTGDAGRMMMTFKKGGAVALSAPGVPSPGGCALEWMLPPRALRRIAD